MERFDPKLKNTTDALNTHRQDLSKKIEPILRDSTSLQEPIFEFKEENKEMLVDDVVTLARMKADGFYCMYLTQEQDSIEETPLKEIESVDELLNLRSHHIHDFYLDNKLDTVIDFEDPKN